MTDEQVLVLALALTSTFAAGLAVEPIDERERERGRTIAVALVSVLVVPPVAWLLGHALELGVAGIGLLAASAAPGGSTGPVLAVVAGGDAATATRLFVITTVLGTVGAIAVIIALDAFDPGLVGRAVALVTAASLAPLALGLALRRWRSAWASAHARTCARLSVMLLVVTVALLCVRHGDQADLQILLCAAVLVPLSMAAAGLARGRARRIAAAQVCGVHNLALALLVLAAIDAPARATLAVLGYGLVMYSITGGVAIVLHMRRRAGGAAR